MELKKTKGAVEKFLLFYEKFDLNDLVLFHEVYSKDVLFEDVFHQIRGSEKLYDYFKKIMSKVTECQFIIHTVVEGSEDAKGKRDVFVTWEMVYSHPLLNKKNVIKVKGASHLLVGDKIDCHRDYLDSSEMLYRHLPVLGSVIKMIEKRV